MQNKLNIKSVSIALLFSVMVSVSFLSCRENQETVITETTTYTCPMHPQIVQNNPSTCPICFMDLVPFDRNNQDEFLTLSQDQMKLANIRTELLSEGSFDAVQRVNARVVNDPEQRTMISSRVAGRLEYLASKEIGKPIEKGQLLYKLYSEQLSSLQQEYLIAKAQAEAFPTDPRFQEIWHASRKRLHLLDQNEAEIRALENSKKTNPYINFYAPASGIVAVLSVYEGEYIEAGAALMQIESYESVWIEADATGSQAENITIGDKLNVTIVGFEDQPAVLSVLLKAPDYRPGSRYITLRGRLQNPRNQWRPGMQALVELSGKSGSRDLFLPANAILYDAQRAHVWIETEPGIFEPREVKTGKQTAGKVQIVAGVDKGENIVTSGAYLLYSEYLLKKGSLPF